MDDGFYYCDLDTSLDESLDHAVWSPRTDGTPRRLCALPPEDSDASSTSLESYYVAQASMTCAPLKVVLMGESGVGKTSLYNVARSASSTPPRPTIGVDFCSLAVPEHNVRLQLWDTAGMERFAPLDTVYYRSTAAMVLVYALDDSRSFERLDERWMPLVERARDDALQLNGTQPLLFVVGTKSDRLGGDHLVDADDERRWAAERGAVAHCVTTAHSRASVRALFVDAVARELARRRDDYTPNADRARAVSNEDLLLPVIDVDTQRRLHVAAKRRRRKRDAPTASSCPCM